MQYKLIMENWRKYLTQEDLGSKLLSNDPKQREFARLIESIGKKKDLKLGLAAPGPAAIPALIIQALVRAAPALVKSKETLAMLAAVVSQRVSDLVSDDEADKNDNLKDAIQKIAKDVVKKKKEETKCNEGLYRGQGLRVTPQANAARIVAGADYEGTRQGDKYGGLYLSVYGSDKVKKSNQEICAGTLGYARDSKNQNHENFFKISFECCKEQIQERGFGGITKIKKQELINLKQRGLKVLAAYKSVPTPEYLILDSTIITDIQKLGTYNYELSYDENVNILCAKM